MATSLAGLSDHAGDCIAPCSASCPAGLDIPGFVYEIAVGRPRRTMAVLSERLALPGSLALLGPAEHPHPLFPLLLGLVLRELVEQVGVPVATVAGEVHDLVIAQHDVHASTDGFGLGLESSRDTPAIERSGCV